MTLLDISKLKNKEADDTSSNTKASIQNESDNTKEAPAEAEISKIKKLISEGLSCVSEDKKLAEQKYEEIQKKYDSLSKNDKQEVYEECMKLFNALK